MLSFSSNLVGFLRRRSRGLWVPACAGMTIWVALWAPSAFAAADIEGASLSASSLPADLDPALREQLEAMDAKLADVHDFEATFTKEKFTPLLKKPLTSRGTVRATRDAVRWDTTEPRPSYTLIKDGEVLLYDPQEKRVEIYPMQGRMASFGSSPIPQVRALVEQFVIAMIEDEDRPEGIVTLRLTPKSAEISEQIDHLVFVVDIENAHIVELQIHQPAGERTVYRFDSVTLNPGLDDDQLTLDLPDDVTTVRPYGDSQ